MKLAFLAAVAVLVTSEAMAQAPIPVSEALGNAIIAEAKSGTIGSDQMRAFARVALGDGRLDPAEAAFFEAARDRGTLNVQIAGSARSLTVEAGAQTLAKLIRGPVDMNALWADPKGFADLAEVASWGPVTEQRLVSFVANKLAPAMSASRIDNGFDPLRSELNRKWSEIQALPEADRHASQRLLYLGARKVATAANGPIVLYSWLTPPDWEEDEAWEF